MEKYCTNNKNKCHRGGKRKNRGIEKIIERSLERKE